MRSKKKQIEKKSHFNNNKKSYKSENTITLSNNLANICKKQAHPLIKFNWAKVHPGNFLRETIIEVTSNDHSVTKVTNTEKEENGQKMSNSSPAFRIPVKITTNITNETKNQLHEEHLVQNVEEIRKKQCPSIQRNSIEEKFVHHIVQNDHRGNLICSRGDRVGFNEQYEVVKKLGEGEFARVVQVREVKNQQHKRQAQVFKALKIVRNDERYRKAAWAEVEVLEKLRQCNKINGNGSNLIIQLLGSFEFHGHVCMIFEPYGQSVFEFMKSNQYHPYPMDQIRYIAYQLIYAVNFLHNQRITHTDLKPENILFVNSAKYQMVQRWNAFDPFWDVGKKKRKQWIRVVEDASIRIIDLGAAVFDHQHHAHIVSTRHYRAPEIILQIGWSYPCDIWSIGAILFELYTGYPMFPKMNDIQHMAMIERILEPFPYWMQHASRTEYFRNGTLDCDEKTIQIVQKRAKKLQRYIKVDEPQHIMLFALIQSMLSIEPSNRLTLLQAQNHSFFDDLEPELRNKALTGINTIRN